MDNNDASSVTIIYDGECPFCSRYVKLLRLREAFGDVDVIDARSEHPLAKQAVRRFNMDDGMAARLGDRWYHGADCMNVLSLASTRSSILNRAMAAVFSDPRRAKLLYPWLRAGRNATLRLLGRSRIMDR